MRINGHLAEGDVYTILRLLGRTRSSGLLRLCTNDREATLAVHNGHVLRASVASGVSLGEALVMSGAVEPAAIEQALMVQRGLAQPKRVGSILVGMGMTGKARVGAALADGIRDVVELTATWTGASYEFDSHVAADPDSTFGGVEIDLLVPGYKSRPRVPRGH